MDEIPLEVLAMIFERLPVGRMSSGLQEMAVHHRPPDELRWLTVNLIRFEILNAVENSVVNLVVNQKELFTICKLVNFASQ